MNIYLILQMASDAMGEREAIVSGDQRMTFADLDKASRQVADKLKTGQRLSYLAENSPAVPAAIFGAALAATPFVPVNYRLALDQIETLMARLSPALLITDQERSFVDIETMNMRDILSGNEKPGEAPDIESAVSIELFTSGTTGEAKSAILLHPWFR